MILNIERKEGEDERDEQREGIRRGGRSHGPTQMVGLGEM